MSTNKSEPTRKVDVHLTDNGTPFAYSMTSHKNVKVRAEVQPPLQLPGLIIFVHGVNSEGEWYDYAERSLCAGLNQRLGLEGEHGLKENNYEGGFFVNSDKSEGGWEHTYETVSYTHLTLPTKLEV